MIQAALEREAQAKDDMDRVIFLGLCARLKNFVETDDIEGGRAIADQMRSDFTDEQMFRYMA